MSNSGLQEPAEAVERSEPRTCAPGALAAGQPARPPPQDPRIERGEDNRDDGDGGENGGDD